MVKVVEIPEGIEIGDIFEESFSDIEAKSTLSKESKIESKSVSS